MAFVGVTTTDATGWLLTLTSTVACTVPACPGVVIVAVMVALPTATPVATPAELTVATAALLVLHAMVRPTVESGSPPALKRFRVRLTVAPTWTLAGDGRITALATGSISTVTFTDAVGVVPFGPAPGADTVIVAVPGEMAVIRPVPDTVATASLLDRHVSVRPVSTWPPASRAVAVKVRVPPAGTLPPLGAIVRLATGVGCTVTIDVPTLPSPMAEIVAWPTATPVTRPVLSTVATVGWLVDHSSSLLGSDVAVAVQGLALQLEGLPGGDRCRRRRDPHERDRFLGNRHGDGARLAAA